MTPAAPRALLLGGPGRYPFNGHLRLSLRHDRARLHIAAVVASGSEPPVAFDAAAALRAQLVDVSGRTRFALLRSAWERLSELDLGLLGPARGQDLGLLMVAWDDDGLGVAGTGLSALHAVADGVEPLLEGEHPLFGIRGIPGSPPGVFTPHEPPRAVVGVPACGSVDPGSWSDWQRACGLRDGGVA